MEDRPYQTEFYEQAREAYKAGHRRILCVLPTGGGKSVMAARMMSMAAAKGRRSLFFADQRELVTQTTDKLNRMGQANSTLIANVTNEHDSAEDFSQSDLCQTISKDTLWSRAVRSNKIEMPRADIVHLDEAHGSLAKTWKSISDHYSEAVIFGWTATPVRGDGQGLGLSDDGKTGLFDHMIIAGSYSELQASGHLVPVRVLSPANFRLDTSGLKVRTGDYVKRALQERVNKDGMVGDIISHWKERADDRQTIVFASGIDHSINIRDQFRAAGITAEHIDGSTPSAGIENERADILGRVSDGSTRVLVNYGVATTGVDIPSLKVMVCARPTKSFGLWRQMGGRIQRPFEGHDHCLILDHTDNSVEFGYPDEDVEWDLHSHKGYLPKPKKKAPSDDGASGRKCPQCSTTYAAKACPQCGYMQERSGKYVEMQEGKLAALERSKADKLKDTQSARQKYWDYAVGVAIGRRMKIGAAAHMYRREYGKWPRGLRNTPKGSQWQMTATEFYRQVIKEANQKSSDEAKRQASLL